MSGEAMESALVIETPEARTPEEMRGKILELERAMLARPDLHIEFKTVHHFAPGIYMRELHIPKGAILTGKIHKTEHLNILSQGRLIVWTEDGMKELSASTVVKSLPGIKRAGHALEDSVWITVHPNPEDIEDVKRLEDMLVVDSYEQLEAFMALKQITKEGE
jgi:quercetin dioxygenase-like cupin family protein